MFDNNYFEAREQWATATKENSARHAEAWGTVNSRGWGEVIMDEPIMFGVTFTEQPVVSYGFALDDDDQAVDGRLPRCSGGVLRWVRTASDFYIGAHVFVTVATADPILVAQQAQIGGVYDEFGDDPKYDLTHSFTFKALAIKDVSG